MSDKTYDVKNRDGDVIYQVYLASETREPHFPSGSIVLRKDFDDVNTLDHLTIDEARELHDALVAAIQDAEAQQAL